MTIGLALSLLKILSPLALEIGKGRSKKAKKQADELNKAVTILKTYAKIDTKPNVSNPGDSLRNRPRKATPKSTDS